ncbi:MAG TPA: hypothetical protein VFH71_06405 [Rhodanobacteraceae bacterium]|nr:hypothetical protein [Rhodanobacteraceae bacterium]
MSFPGPGVALLPHSFEFNGELAVLRVAGEHTLQQMVDAVTAAMRRATEQGAAKLLADITSATGFDPPTLASRHELVAQWAETGRGHLRVAMVVRAEFLDPDRYGVILANNLGFALNLFENEERARAWLAG